MLRHGDKVKLCYYEGEAQVESYWTVEEYDNGLLKVFKPAGDFTVKGINGETTSMKEEATKPVIFNMRSIGFLTAELD